MKTDRSSALLDRQLAVTDGNALLEPSRYTVRNYKFSKRKKRLKSSLLAELIDDKTENEPSVFRKSHFWYW